MTLARWGRAVLAILVVLLAAGAVGCPCTDTIVNSNPWLRWQLFARFGADRVCEQMVRRGVPIRTAVPIPGAPPAVGRFYPEACQSNLDEKRRTLSILVSGNGYAWTPATQKMSFDCSVLVEYRPDFYKDGSTIYAWFDVAAAPSPPQFRIRYIEQPVTSIAFRALPVEWFATSLARSFVQMQLERGFTVIQSSDGEDFTLGHLAVGQKPAHPYDASGGRYTYANETVEIHGQQQEFLGPFDVDSNGRALFLKMRVEGAPLDIFLVSKEVGAIWRTKYQFSSPPPPPPPGAPILQMAQTPPNGQFDGWVPVRKGQYYVVLDNSVSAGILRPAGKLPSPLDPSIARSATVSFLVESGDEP